jgi:3-dehydroquinate synthase
MKELLVQTGVPYSIKIGRGLLCRAGEALRSVTGAGRAAVVTDSNVAPLYANRLLQCLQAAGFATSLFVFQAGEEQKRLRTIEEIYAHLYKHGITRKDVVVALGGGVTGDMAGFAAATYLRGMDFIQVPTTLLAQIDSSVGGKTGVDLPFGKNLAGAFWQPRLVLIDPDTLDTLPPRYFADGMAEAIKYGCIKSRTLFDRILEGNACEFIEELIYACVDIKRQVVEQDERDHGERMLLNFGHTLGHALEKLYNYRTLSHGEAVGIGMVRITAAAERAGLTETGSAQRITAALRAYGLPAEDPHTAVELATAAYGDKKSEGERLHLVLLRAVGDGVVHTIPRAGLAEFLQGEAVL